MNVPVLNIVDKMCRADDGAELCASEVQVWRDELGRKLATCYAIDGRHWVDIPGVACFGVGRLSNAVEAIPYDSADPEEINDVYNDSVLPVALHVHGVEALHASAVLSPRGVVAGAAGRSGRSHWHGCLPALADLIVGPDRR